MAERTKPHLPLDHEPEAVVWARQRDNRTQQSLAEAIGVSGGHMSEIEAGHRNAPPHLIDRMAQVLNCPRSVLERKRYAKSGGEAA